MPIPSMHLAIDRDFKARPLMSNTLYLVINHQDAIAINQFGTYLSSKNVNYHTIDNQTLYQYANHFNADDIYQYLFKKYRLQYDQTHPQNLKEVIMTFQIGQIDFEYHYLRQYNNVINKYTKIEPLHAKNLFNKMYQQQHL